jgi:acyl carrier protein
MIDEDAVLEAIAATCGVERSALRREGMLVGYGLDSARALELLARLEREHGIVIDDEDLAGVRTVADLVALAVRP